MKCLLLGMSLILFTQMGQVYAEKNDQISVEAALAVEHTKQQKEKDILPPVGKTLFSSFDIDMIADGSTDTTTSLSFTVLDSKKGVARIKIEVFEKNGDVIKNIYITGRSGNQYSGNSSIFIGSSNIVITRVKDNLEVVQTYIDNETNTVGVSRAIFPLCHCSDDNG